MQWPRSSLWRHANFLKLWTGQTFSLFGTSITELALPLTAILLLDATAPQMGVLRAAEYLPFLLAGPFVGVWVDRRRRRPLLITAWGWAQPWSARCCLSVRVRY